MNPFANVENFQLSNSYSFKLIEKLSKKSNTTKVKALIELDKTEVEVCHSSLLINNLLPLFEEDDHLIQKFSKCIFIKHFKSYPDESINILDSINFDWISFTVNENIFTSSIGEIIINHQPKVGSLDLFYYLLSNFYYQFTTSNISKVPVFSYVGNFEEIKTNKKRYSFLYKILTFIKKIKVPEMNKNALYNISIEFENQVLEFLLSPDCTGKDDWPKHLILLDIYNNVNKRKLISDIPLIKDDTLCRILNKLEENNISASFIYEHCVEESKIFIVCDFIKNDKEKVEFIHKNIKKHNKLILKIFELKVANIEEEISKIILILGDFEYNKIISQVSNNFTITNSKIIRLLKIGHLDNNNLVDLTFIVKEKLSIIEKNSLLKNIEDIKYWNKLSTMLSENLLVKILGKYKQDVIDELDFTNLFCRFSNQMELIREKYGDVRYNLSKVISSIDDYKLIYTLLLNLENKERENIIKHTNTYLDKSGHYYLKTILLYFSNYNEEFVDIQYDLIHFLPFTKIPFYQKLLSINYDSFLTFIESYLSVIDIKEKYNSLFVGFNLDTKLFDREFQMPFYDEKLSAIYKALSQNYHQLDIKGDLLMRILGFLCYEKIGTISEPIANYKSVKVNLGINNFLYERILLELDLGNKEISFNAMKDLLETEFINQYKHLDVLIRNGVVKCTGVKNPTFLSFEALSKIVDEIIAGRVDFSVKVPTDKQIKCFDLIKNYSSSFDALEMMENDNNLLFSFLRSKRIQLYEKLIIASTKFCTSVMIDGYNYSKLEKSVTDESIFLFVCDIFNKFKRNYFYIISFMINKISNIYLALLIEREITVRCMEDLDFDFMLYEFFVNSLILNSKQDEIKSFATAFPTFYRNIIKEKYCGFNFVYDKIINDDFMKGIVNTKYEYDFSVYYSTTLEYYHLKYSYTVDSIRSHLEFTIPINFKSPGHIKNINSSSSKNTKINKSLLQLNELTKKTTKYHEIFLYWKTNIDNKVAGHVECLICYFIIDSKYQSYPDYTCEECKVKFHTCCIFKWFDRSKTYKCPMCRSELK